MVSVSQCSFALVCVILVITPFNIITSTEARRLSASGSGSFNVGAEKSLSLGGLDLTQIPVLGQVLQLPGLDQVTQLLNTLKLQTAIDALQKAITTGFPTLTTFYDLFNNGLMKLYKLGFAIDLSKYVSADTLYQFAMVIENGLAKLGLDSIASQIYEVSADFKDTDVSASGSISTNTGFAFVYKDVMFLKFEVEKLLNVASLGKILAYFQSISAYLQSYAGYIGTALGYAQKLPQCLAA